MRNIKYYSKFFRTQDANDPCVYNLERVEKWGNHELFNNVFEYHESARVNYYDVPSMNNYLLYTVEGQPFRTKSFKILFEMSPVSYPYGIVRSEALDEVVLFKMTEVNTFEVYVIAKHASNVLNCFQLLIDGYLEEEIDNIKMEIDLRCS